MAKQNSQFPPSPTSRLNIHTSARMRRDNTTTILELPDELLDQILAELKWGTATPAFDTLQFFETFTENTADIQRVRLTCRRFASRAFPLLVPVASVSISDPPSLERLEQIAGHTLFAPYVKAVHVSFGFYEPELVADIRLLAAHLVHIWRGTGRLAQTLDDLDSFCYEEIEANSEKEGMRLLRREHAEYQRRYEAQQNLGLSSAAERIAKAMARMPKATRLILSDTPPCSAAAAAPADGGWLLRPTSWATAFKLNRGSPPIDILFGLPAAVHKAGVMLTGLRIHRLRLPAHLPLWSPRPEDWESIYNDPPPPEVGDLRAACCSLRILEFTPDYEPNCWPTASPTHLAWPGMTASYMMVCRPIGQLLGWILTASSRLTHVSVDLQLVHGSFPYELAMPASPLSWPCIRGLRLQDGTLEARTLTNFLSATTDTLTALDLEGMLLCASAVGDWPFTTPPHSWAVVLNQLRDHARSSVCRSIRLRRPRGAEFEDSSVSETDMAHLRSLFEPDDVGLSAVDRFIGGITDRNPLVEAGKTPFLYPRPRHQGT